VKRYRLAIEPLDLGADVRAVGLELAENDENREPARGADAAQIWNRVLMAVAGTEPWALDFPSHLDRLREYCQRHGIAFRDASSRSVVIRVAGFEKEPEALPALLERFESEMLGARAGGPIEAGDPALEGELARRGVDAYHAVFANYFFCAVCDFKEGSLVFFSKRLWASEVIRRVRPVLAGLDVEVLLPA
jgi:hypothetical protein